MGASLRGASRRPEPPSPARRSFLRARRRLSGEGFTPRSFRQVGTYLSRAAAVSASSSAQETSTSGAGSNASPFPVRTRATLVARRRKRSSTSPIFVSASIRRPPAFGSRRGRGNGRRGRRAPCSRGRGSRPIDPCRSGDAGTRRVRRRTRRRSRGDLPRAIADVLKLSPSCDVVKLVRIGDDIDARQVRFRQPLQFLRGGPPARRLTPLDVEDLLGAGDATRSPYGDEIDGETLLVANGERSKNDGALGDEPGAVPHPPEPRPRNVEPDGRLLVADALPTGEVVDPGGLFPCLVGHHGKALDVFLGRDTPPDRALLPVVAEPALPGELVAATELGGVVAGAGHHRTPSISAIACSAQSRNCLARDSAFSP